MYTDHWQLTRKPFENSPDPRFLYYSVEHRQALDRLMRAAEEHKGAALLTGEYGCGKTTLIRTLLKSLPSHKYHAGLVNNPRLGEIELLNEILYQLGQDSQHQNMLLLNRAIGDLFFRNVQEGRHTVIVIDEAQLIADPDAFERLRLLLNYQLEDRSLVTLVLSGQSDLRGHIKAMPQFEQRVDLWCHLNNFGYDDMTRYVAHRLRIAGREEPVFTEDALRLIYSITHGIPRRINNVCDLCLFEGANRNLDKIDGDIVRSIAS